MLGPCLMGTMDCVVVMVMATPQPVKETFSMNNLRGVIRIHNAFLSITQFCSSIILTGYSPVLLLIRLLVSLLVVCSACAWC